MKPSTETPSPAVVLVVDTDPRLPELLRGLAPVDRTLEVHHAGTAADAEAMCRALRVDLALIDPALPDGSGLELARRLTSARRPAAAIVVAADNDFATAQRAMRAGAADCLSRASLDLEHLESSVRIALDRQQRDLATRRRIARLKKLCRRLNEARIEVADQVDVLCNDLVTAYQELAVQMQASQREVSFEETTADELDLEALLRQTLEHVVELTGPTNAAVFLPASMDEFSLGGYVNYDCTSDSADMLLRHLADVLAPKVADATEPVHVRDAVTMRSWLGDDAAWLEGAEMLAISAGSGGEALAVLALFRDADQPFDPEAVRKLEALGPVLGERLERIIRVHHRHWGDDDGPPSAFDIGPGSAEPDDLPSFFDDDEPEGY
ncbi:MAG: response regulator [Planctomycetota bacterium]